MKQVGEQLRPNKARCDARLPPFLRTLVPNACKAARQLADHWRQTRTKPSECNPPKRVTPRFPQSKPRRVLPKPCWQDNLDSPLCNLDFSGGSLTNRVFRWQIRRDQLPFLRLCRHQASHIVIGSVSPNALWAITFTTRGFWTFLKKRAGNCSGWLRCHSFGCKLKDLFFRSSNASCNTAPQPGTMTCFALMLG